MNTLSKCTIERARNAGRLKSARENKKCMPTQKRPRAYHRTKEKKIDIIGHGETIITGN